MRKSGFTIFLASLFIVFFGCDPQQDAFDESLPDFYTLTTQVSPTESGTVKPSGGEFLVGNSAQLKATPAEGYVFDRWEGDITGSSNPAFVRFNSNRSVTAHFSVKQYNLNIEIQGNGIVRETVVERSSAVSVRLDAEAEEGWSFREWSGDLTGTSNPDTISIEDGEEKAVTAIFEQDAPDEYTLTVNTQGEGSVGVDPDKSAYTGGEEVTLTASAASGWSFKEWSGDLSGSDNPAAITVDNDKSITALFEEDEADENTLSLNEIKLFVREMSLTGARQTVDFKTNDFILSLPLDGSPIEITHVQIPAGFYKELELDIDKPDKNAEFDDPDFTDGSDRYSLVVNGIFNDADFTFQSTGKINIEIELEPHLEIVSSQTSVIAITIDFENWFRGDDGEFLDPADSRNAEQINKNIENSFSDFENRF